jgi:hypothetical protein
MFFLNFLKKEKRIGEEAPQNMYRLDLFRKLCMDLFRKKNDTFINVFCLISVTEN